MNEIPPLDCHVDPGPLTLDRAHALMQHHVECVPAACLPRRHALAVLREAGHYRLSTDYDHAPAVGP